MTTTYNGWANYQTWNVALWIGNHEPWYDEARRIVKSLPKSVKTTNLYALYYSKMRKFEGFGTTTPDGVSWTDPTLDIEALDMLIREQSDFI